MPAAPSCWEPVKPMGLCTPIRNTQVNKRGVFAQENPARGELEPHLCYRRETLRNSLPNSPPCPRVLKSTNLLSGCQPAPALPSPSAASSRGGGAQGPSLPFPGGQQRGPPPAAPWQGGQRSPDAGRGLSHLHFSTAPATIVRNSLLE